MSIRQKIAEELQTNCCNWFKGRVCHPEQAEIDRMIQYTQQVFLPNYFKSAENDTILSGIDKLHGIMASQIHRAMFQRCLEKDGTPESKAQVEAIADAVLERFPEIQEMLYEDVLETYQSDPAATGYDEIILTYPGLLALMVHRVAHAMYVLDIPLLPRMMSEYGHRITGIDIHPGAKLGRGLMIDHGTGIVIGETAVVGNHVKIYQGVTLGALYFPRDENGSMVRNTKRHPTVEDYCVLYTNSTVLGGDTVVGHHSVVGSNAWLTESVPPYSKVYYQTESVVKTQRV